MGVLVKKLADEEITAVSLYYQQNRHPPKHSTKRYLRAKSSKSQLLKPDKMHALAAALWNA